MSAEITYCVEVLRLVTDYVRVSAVVAEDAMDAAEKMPGVARAVEAWPDRGGLVGDTEGNGSR